MIVKSFKTQFDVWYYGIAIFLMGTQAFWEQYALIHRQSWCGGCDIHGLKYFLLYNTGNINHGFITPLILCWILKKLHFSNQTIIGLSIFVPFIVLVYVERNDFMDIPFGLLGMIFAVPIMKMILTSEE